MDSYIALTLFGCFFVLVFIGVPISFSIGIATVASMLLMFPGISRQSLFRSDWLMDWITLPYWQSPFIFAGTLMNSGGIAIHLINLAQVMVGRVPGSLGHVNVLANVHIWFRYWFSCCGSCCRWWHTESSSDQRRL